MTRSQLILDVINKKNTSSLPSQCTFSSRSKKIEVAGYLGLTEDEVDVYLGNHIKFTAILDDIIQVDKLDPHRMKAARDAGRYLDVPGEDGMIYDLWGMKYNVNDGGYFNYCHPLQNCDEDDSLLDDYHAPDITDMDTLFSIAEEDLKQYGSDFLVELSGYNGIWEKAGFPAPLPRQIEFARLNITNMLMSKRYLKKLVDEGIVRGWDDPRMPTVMGFKNRGVPPEALKKFCADVGVAKAYSVVNQAQLDSCIRDELNLNAERAMAVLNPVKLTITNYAGEETLDFEKNPLKPEEGTRPVKFTGSVYIDGEDFSLNPPPKYKRLQKGGTVRLKGAYIVSCDDVKLNKNGEVEELLCTYFPESRSGSGQECNVKAKGVVQWVDCKYGVDAEFRQYEALLKDEEYADQDYAERLNTDSEKKFYGKAEPYLAESADETAFQLMRTGYYKKCTQGGLVLSEIVSLKDGFKA